MMVSGDHEHRWGNEQAVRYGSIRHCSCGARLIVIEGHESVITAPAMDEALRGIACDAATIRDLPEREEDVD